jgi:hypothetical protein
VKKDVWRSEYLFALIQPTGNDVTGKVDATVLHWFVPQAVNPSVTAATIDLDRSAAQCKRAGSFVSPFSDPSAVYLVTLTSSGGEFLLHPSVFNVDLASLSGLDLSLVLQIVASETETYRYAAIASAIAPVIAAAECPSCYHGASAPITLGDGSCLCPAGTLWTRLPNNDLQCSVPGYPKIQDVRPGLSGDTSVYGRDMWQRGATADITWTVEGQLPALLIEILPVDNRGVVVAEPLSYSLSEDEVASGSLTVTLPVSFAPTATHAAVGFLSPDAQAHAPGTPGRYLAQETYFVLANAGCIVDDVHGECRAAGSCGGPSDPFRVAAGPGTCEDLGVDHEVSVCCVTQRNPAPLPADYVYDRLDIVSPGNDNLDDSVVQIFMGEEHPIRFVVMDKPKNSAWALYRVGYVTSGDPENANWLDQQAGKGSVELVTSSDDDESTLLSTHEVAGRPGVTATLRTVNHRFTSLGIAQMGVHVARLVLVQQDEERALVSVACAYAPCAPEPEFDWSALEFNDRNLVGQCVPAHVCTEANGRIVDENLFSDDSDNCAPDLGDAVCCRPQWTGGQDGKFRAAAADDGDSSISLPTIVAAVAAGVCCLLACVAGAVVMVAVSRRNARSKHNLALPAVHHEPYGGRQRSRRSSTNNVRR